MVILHGVNMVYKVGSYRPADAGFGADDATFLRRHGFNTSGSGSSTRGSSRSRPRRRASPGYRRGYLRSIAKHRVACSPSSGIFSLLDFHQDLYNERFQGEGWPDWQVLDDGVPSEPQAGFPGQLPRQRRASTAPSTTSGPTPPAEGRGLQDAYAAAWRRVAAKFRDAPLRRRLRPAQRALARHRPSRPTTASTPPAARPSTRTTLAPFNERVIDAIRGVDPETLVFYEPLVTFDFGADSKLPDTGDPAAGFSFHNYCLPGALGGPGSGPACEPLEDHGVRERRQAVDARPATSRS